MTNDLAAALAALQEAVRSDAPGCAERIDGAVARIHDLQDERSIGPMLLILDDDYTFQELMWSIVHLAESFDAAIYVAALVDVLPHVEASAPQWAYTLVRRLLNGDVDRMLLAERLKLAIPDRPDIREGINRTLHAVIEENGDRVSEKVAQVRAVAGL